MKSKQFSTDERVKKKIITWKEFVITYAVLLLLVGLQMGIIVLPFFQTINSFFHVFSVMLYWVVVSAAFLYITNIQIKDSYDKPMRKLSEAAKKVANGDFSVYLEPVHPPDKYDYIDVMFADFNVMVQELGSIETLKNDFVANVSHEIKTPLAVIKNYTEMLKNTQLTPETHGEYIDIIVKATANLSSLVTNILRLNKLDNQEIETNVTQYDLCRQLAECVFAFETLIEEKNIEIEVDIEDCAIITADENMLEIVWNNLLSNALKFTENGGRILIKQTSEAENVTITFADSGCGMDKNTLNHVFDKFYQGDTSHSGAGNGLGLALVYRIVEKAGGTISVTSTLGEGSTFYITLPVK